MSFKSIKTILANSLIEFIVYVIKNWLLSIIFKELNTKLHVNVKILKKYLLNNVGALIFVNVSYVFALYSLIFIKCAMIYVIIIINTSELIKVNTLKLLVISVFCWNFLIVDIAETPDVPEVILDFDFYISLSTLF